MSNHQDGEITEKVFTEVNEGRIEELDDPNHQVDYSLLQYCGSKHGIEVSISR
jgi:hypothetical protein